MKRAVLLVGLMAIQPGLGNAQAQAGPVEVPLRMAGGRLIVPVMTAGGASLDFALSTGSAVTVLSESGAAKLGTDGPPTLGGLPIPMDRRSTVPDSSLRADGQVLGGMISSNMLNGYDVLIDVPGGKLVLKPIGPRVAWEGVSLSDPIPLRVFHGVALAFDVMLGGRDYPALLDIGTPVVVVNGGVKSDLAIEDEAVSTLTVGSVTFDRVSVSVRDLDVFRMWSPDGSGVVLVGAPITYDCAIALSWVHREMRTCLQ